MYTKYAEYRDAKGMTDYRVSEETGIPRSTFSDWKAGKYEPKADKLLAISNLLECPIEDLIKTKEKEVV